MKRVNSILNRLSWFMWAIIVVVGMGLGIRIGAKVTTGYKDNEIAIIQDALGDALASLREVKLELDANKVIILAWDCVTSFYTEASSGGVQANGERFDEDRFTAAHRVLPFGTVLIVENPKNGKVSPVRIEDRGPAAWTGRSLDVSLAVARRLGIVEQGEAKLRCYLMVDGRPSKED